VGHPERKEAQAWPPETQRVFEVVLAWFKGKGHVSPQAEALATATVKELMRRKRGPVALISDLSPEIGRAVGLVLAAFPGAKITNYGHKAGTAL
jgi:hypothetical protein